MKKLSFPDGWSNLSDAQVQEYIEYLEKHYKRYHVVVPDNHSVKIGNVEICYKNLKAENGRQEKHYIVNGKAFPWYSILGDKLSWLYNNLAKKYAKPFKEKAKEFLQDNCEIICYSGIGLAAVALFIWGCILADEAEKKREQEFIQKTAKEVVKQLQQEQQKDTILYQPKKQY